MIEKYLESDDEGNNQNYNEIRNKVNYQQYTPNFKKNANINNQNNINKNNDQIEDMKIKPLGWKKNTNAYMNINNAIQENRGKKEYTAHIYSTIQKIKNVNDNKNKKKSKILFFNIIFLFIEPGIFEKNVLNKRYSGKSDRVALYKMYQQEWNKSLYKK